MEKFVTFHFETRDLQKCHCAHFLLATCHWICRPSLRVVSFPSETPWKENKFLFANGYQLEMASGMGACVHFI